MHALAWPGIAPPAPWAALVPGREIAGAVERRLVLPIAAFVVRRPGTKGARAVGSRV